MMNDTIIIAILSSGALSALITGLFSLLQTRKSRKTGIEHKIDKISEEQANIVKNQHRHEMDILRVELKLMISSFPEKEDDILRIAQHYFTEGGNWVMSSVFKQWLDQRGLKLPDWYTD